MRVVKPSERSLFYFLGAVAVIYVFLGGLKTIAEFDLGWQMATGRWIMQHHHIPSVDVFSYTAAGQPWIYPVGAGLIFYGAYLLAGYPLISWFAAFVCVAVVAILLRRGSVATALLCLLAVPFIDARTTPRAEMFTVLLFAATLSILWEQYESGKARLWLLPIIMVAWVNLHPGFIGGLGLLGAYLMLEGFDIAAPDKRGAAVQRVRSAMPWLAATCTVTLLNPWGWRVFEVIARQEGAMQAHSQLILEWAPISMNWAHISSGLSLRDPDEFYVLFLIVVAAVLFALSRRQFGPAILLVAATLGPTRHMRLTALFAVVVVIVAGAVLSPLVKQIRQSFGTNRVRLALGAAVLLPFLALTTTRVIAIVTDRAYLSGTNIVSFGTGLSWWFPERAADFVERERLPGQIFSTGSEGAYLAFRLGPHYKNYIDGRAIPFGTDLMLRSGRLKASPPDSLEWRQEVQRYGINVILLPIGRFGALQFFPTLRDFCNSDSWRPVYLDEVSVVFLRRTPDTEFLINRLQIDCSTAPLPRAIPQGNTTRAFNEWANAASVLRALHRDDEALAATNKALSLFPSSGYLHFMRGHMYEEAGDLQQAELDYINSTKLEPKLVAPWSALAAYYQSHGQLPQAIEAWKQAAAVAGWPGESLVKVGYAELQAMHPKEALAAFDAAADSLPAHHELIVNDSFLANVAHGRARCWYHLGNLSRATSYEEEAARILPSQDVLLQLAQLYDVGGRSAEANRIRSQVAMPVPER